MVVIRGSAVSLERTCGLMVVSCALAAVVRIKRNQLKTSALLISSPRAFPPALPDLRALVVLPDNVGKRVERTPGHRARNNRVREAQSDIHPRSRLRSSDEDPR